MVDIIRLNSDPHARTQRLLPWYVAGALKDNELGEVEAHLTECAECREDLEIERELAHQIRTLSTDSKLGWAALRSRIDSPSTGLPGATLFSRSIPLGWAVAAQAASLAILAPIFTLALARPELLHPAHAAAHGNLKVVFRPEASVATLRMILRQNQARIVDGPTAADAYVLHVAADQRAAVLARLKSDRNISLAELIDTGDC
jgi:hypothetical protein